MFERLYELDLFVRRSTDNFYNQVCLKPDERSLHQAVKDHVERIKESFSNTSDEIEQFFRELSHLTEDFKTQEHDLRMKDDSDEITSKISTVEILLDSINEQERQLDLNINDPEPATQHQCSLEKMMELNPDFVKRLRDLISNDDRERPCGANFFSENIYATRNFYQTIKSDGETEINNIRDKFRKYPVVLLVFRKASEEGRVYTVLISLFDVRIIYSDPAFAKGEAVLLTVNAKVFAINF